LDFFRNLKTKFATLWALQFFIFSMIKLVLFSLLTLVLLLIAFRILYLNHPYFFYFPGLLFRINHPIKHSDFSDIIWKQDIETTTAAKYTAEKESQPNIILIVCDDLGINDLSMGSGVSTPNIDSIFQNGIKFNNAYSAHATCAPSRAALYTGRFPSRFGFEFTPVPAIFARILSYDESNGRSIYVPKFHAKRALSIIPMSAMAVSSNETFISNMLRDKGYRLKINC
jgi:hypothetical protein